MSLENIKTGLRILYGLLVLMFVIVVLLSLVVWRQSALSLNVRWFNDRPFIRVSNTVYPPVTDGPDALGKEGTMHVELGFREDGVVVWREVKSEEHK